MVEKTIAFDDEDIFIFGLDFTQAVEQELEGRFQKDGIQELESQFFRSTTLKLEDPSLTDTQDRTFQSAARESLEASYSKNENSTRVT